MPRPSGRKRQLTLHAIQDAPAPHVGAVPGVPQGSVLVLPWRNSASPLLRGHAPADPDAGGVPEGSRRSNDRRIASPVSPSTPEGSRPANPDPRTASPAELRRARRSPVLAGRRYPRLWGAVGLYGFIPRWLSIEREQSGRIQTAGLKPLPQEEEVWRILLPMGGLLGSPQQFCRREGN